MRGETKTIPEIKRSEIDRDIRDEFIKFEK